MASSPASAEGKKTKDTPTETTKEKISKPGKGNRQHTVTSAGPVSIQVHVRNVGCYTEKKRPLKDPSPQIRKKQWTEKTVQQAREERSKIMKKATKVRACSVPGCASSETRFMKPQAFREHVPGIFHEGLPYDDKQVNTRRVKALEQAARWLLGKPATLEDLLSFLRIQRLLDTVEHCEVSEVQRNAMIGMCKHLKAKQPEVFDLAAANSPGVLVHWIVVLLIVAVLN